VTASRRALFGTGHASHIGTLGWIDAMTRFLESSMNDRTTGPSVTATARLQAAPSGGHNTFGVAKCAARAFSTPQLEA